LIGDAVVVADVVSGTIQLWNDAASLMFGYERDEATGMPVTTLVPENCVPATGQGSRDSLRTGPFV
jgi:PAS domain S-box-containing protein